MERQGYFTADARNRIRKAVRAYESGAGRAPTGYADEYSYPPPPTLWLARANAVYMPDTVGTFTIQKPGTNKGDEVDGSDTADAYVRDGLTYQNGLYLLVEACGASDALFEVMNPELIVLATALADIAQAGIGNANIVGNTVSVTADFGAVKNGSILVVNWHRVSRYWSVIQTNTCP